MDVVGEIMVNMDYFALLFFRVSGLVFASPIFGRMNVPAIARISLITALTILFFASFEQVVPLQYTTVLGFLLLAVMELMMGVALSFITNIFFSLVAFTAGQLIDMQIGFGIVNVFDIQNNTQIPMMGNVLNIMMLMMFFSVDGHLRLIEIIYLTIERMPIGTMIMSPLIGITVIEIFIRTFLLGVMMALPILASGLTLEMAFGMMMRAVPQIHMFIVGIPLKVIVGLFIFAVTLPVFIGFTERVFSEMFMSLELAFDAFIG